MKTLPLLSTVIALSASSGASEGRGPIAMRDASMAPTVPEVAEGAELPEWLHVMPYGVWEGHYVGTFQFTDEMADQVIANHSRRGIDVVIDFEHQTLNTEWNGQPAPAMGWGDRFEKRDNGLWLHVREWTPRGAEHLRNREYRYLSPVLEPNAYDGKTGQWVGAQIGSVALTNNPFLVGALEPVAARNRNKETPMPLRTALITLLALSATATDEEIEAEAQRLKTFEGDLAAELGAEPAACKAKVAELKVHAHLGEIACTEASLDPSAADAEVKLRAELKHTGMVPLSEHLEALNAAGAQTQALSDEQLLEQLQAEGKLAPVAMSWAKRHIKRDPEGFRQWAMTAKVVVPVGSQVPAGKKPPTSNELSEADKRVCKQLGLSEEAFKAANS